MTTDDQLERMRQDWDRRARENARYYVASSQSDWDDEDFYASGEDAIRNYILNDLGNICQGNRPEEMRVLEIGCGTGRVTCALARVFGEVHAVDISGEMVARARAATARFSNVHIYQNNGRDLDVLPPPPPPFHLTSRTRRSFSNTSPAARLSKVMFPPLLDDCVQALSSNFNCRELRFPKTP